MPSSVWVCDVLSAGVRPPDVARVRHRLPDRAAHQPQQVPLSPPPPPASPLHCLLHHTLLSSYMFPLTTPLSLCSRLLRLSPDVADLSKLAVLDVSHNYIRCLPVEIKSMAALTTLNVGTCMPQFGEWARGDHTSTSGACTAKLARWDIAMVASRSGHSVVSDQWLDDCVPSSLSL